MRRILSFIIFLVVFSVSFPSYSYAAVDEGYEGDNPLGNFTFVTPNNPLSINAATNPVTIRFDNLGDIQTSKIRVCLRSNMCIRNPALWDRFRGVTRETIATSLSKIGLPSSDLDTQAFNDDDFGYDNIAAGGQITVCGDGDSALKAGSDCGSGDYFHAGHTYAVTLYVSQGGNYIMVGQASFYVNHVYPVVTPRLNVIQRDADQGPTYQIAVELTAPTLGGGNNRNNYQVSIDGVAKPQCYTLPGDNIHEFPKDDEIDNGATLIPRVDYTIKVNEQVNDRNTTSCSGGFTFWELKCKIIPASNGQPARFENNSCIATQDPNESEKSVEEKVETFSKNPCRPFPDGSIYGYDDPSRCILFGSAIGPIGTTPIEFISTIFSFILTLAGVGALGLIIFSGYKLMTSRGNKEVIQSARETITSAIIGLIFIILSFVILSVIGSQILRIPGFS